MTVKLIRDRIPMIAAGHGQRLDTRTAEPGEVPVLLRAKVLEEAHEVAVADPEDLLEELADVLEAVHALTLAAGHTLDDLEAARALKAEVRGGFTLGLVLEQPKQPPSEEQLVRDHVMTLHLIGGQLTEIEGWMWQRLADVREAEAEPPST
ncbi:nucleoside triphosphate pyrophosphohydrolase [Streptomyces murinus]|uniref:nucleoside triphosphate pyrophosphohydrolase n=1 Tax=Streptomyces murinus TaxID=33900 RepID=UPI00381891EE